LISTEEDILNICKEDPWMMEVLKTAQTLDLNDWWVCAGFVRSKIWDSLHELEKRTQIPDVDVIYFDPININEDYEKELEEILRTIMPNVPWSVKNQARMHLINNIPPYSSSVDAIAKFSETVTALGLTLNNFGQIILTAPWGINDLVHLEVRPTPYFMKSGELIRIYEERIVKKNWQEKWNKIKVYHVKTKVE
jgi:uncharacterized protein